MTNNPGEYVGSAPQRMIRPVSRIVLVTMFASLLSILGGGTANAVTRVETITSGASVRGNGCGFAKVRVLGDWKYNAFNDITINVLGPHGGYQDDAYFQNNHRDEVMTDVRLCTGSDSGGTYRVRVEVNGYNKNHELVTTMADWANFTFEKLPLLRSTVLRYVRYHAGAGAYPYAVIGKLLREGKGLQGRKVQLQGYISGYGWAVISTQRTKKRGLFGWRFKPNPFLWAYVYQGDRITRWDSSKNFRTPHRGGRASARTVGDMSRFVTSSR